MEASERRAEKQRKRRARIDLSVMSPRQQEDRVERYCKDRHTAAAHGGGDSDPYVTQRCISRRFKHGGWEVVGRLLEQGRLVHAGDTDDGTTVLHPSATRKRTTNHTT